MGFFGNEADNSVPELLALLKDDSAEVRIATILSLGRLGGKRSGVAEALGKFSNDPDPAVQLNAVLALAMLGKVEESQVPELMKALTSKEESTAKAAIKVLSDMGIKDPAKVLPGVLDVLAANGDPVAGNALRILRNMKGAAAPGLPRIVEFYDNAGEKTRQEIVDAVLAIDQQGDQALVVLNKAIKDAPDARDRQEALIGLLRFRDISRDRVLDSACVAFKDKDLQNRILAIKIVRGLGPEASRALPNLIALTEDPDVAVRAEAISAIGVFKPTPPEVLATLERDLKDNDFRVRIAAASSLRALAKEQPEKVVTLLKQAVDAEPNESTRKAMAAVLKAVSAAAEAKPESSQGRTAKGAAKP